MPDREKVIKKLYDMQLTCAIYGDDEAIQTINDVIALLQEPDDLLAPCPFCGGKAVLRTGHAHRSYGDVWAAVIYCTSCNAFLERMATERELELSRDQNIVKQCVTERAMKAWNTEERRNAEVH